MFNFRIHVERSRFSTPDTTDKYNVLSTPHTAVTRRTSTCRQCKQAISLSVLSVYDQQAELSAELPRHYARLFKHTRHFKTLYRAECPSCDPTHSLLECWKKTEHYYWPIPWLWHPWCKWWWWLWLLLLVYYCTSNICLANHFSRFTPVLRHG